MTVSSPKFVIAGAGVVGLLLANALKARNIDFVIFDRDQSVQFRENSGWAITLHYALEAFRDLLPADKAEEIFEAEVRPGFHNADTGTFKYINAGSGETVVSIPPAKRLRVRREHIRRILLRGIDVQWDCRTKDVKFPGSPEIGSNGGVEVECYNGRTFSGDVLLACDGSNSAVRRLICRDGQLYQLPIRFCGAKVRLSASELDAISSQFDPLLFQGTVPSTGTFFWFSTLSTPDYTKQEDVYYAQVNLSWRYKDDEPFSTAEDMAAAMLKNSVGLHPTLKKLVDRAVETPAEILEIKLADWERVEWDSHDGRVLLAGDAAHAMTMYRGEACNVGIFDAVNLVSEIEKTVATSQPWVLAAKNYCSEIKERAQPKVLLSRQACLDAHDMVNIYPGSPSPLLSVRKSPI